MHLLSIIIYIVISLLLVAAILFRSADSAFGLTADHSSQTVLGPAKADYLTRITTFLSVLFIISTVIMMILSSGSSII